MVTEQPFQVDLRGVVDLLSKHIYSSPRVYIRELLQNGHDAIRARAELTGQRDPGWGIRITPASVDQPFVMTDDGVGLTADEVGDLLSTVGRSSKLDIFDLPRTDYLGQFGIGLLSCFMVADEIVMRSASARGGRAIEWRGYAAGTFTVKELDEDLPIGTTVSLIPRPDMVDLVTQPLVSDLATSFGEYLAVPVRIRTRPLATSADHNLHREPVFARSRPDEVEALTAFGHDLIGAPPFAMIPLRAPATGTTGTAFVLPYAPPPAARQSHRVYLGGMLLGERVDEMLPDWAFFVRAALDSTGLSPTASREELVDDEALDLTRAELGNQVRSWVLDLGTSAPHQLAEFVAIHHSGLKSMVRYDEELARFITRWLPLETTVGTMSVGALVSRFPRLRYATTLDEFRQVASFARSDVPVVNGGYVYDTEVVRSLPDIFDDVEVEPVDVLGELDHLSPPPLADRAAVVSLEDRANAVLESCDVVARVFDVPDLAAVYVVDSETVRSIDRDQVIDGASGPWSGVIGSVDGWARARRETSGAGARVGRLCLNWTNSLVRTLSRTSDEAVFVRAVQVLYVQALLAGHHPLGARERTIMTTSLSELIALSVGLDQGLEHL